MSPNESFIEETTDLDEEALDAMHAQFRKEDRLLAESGIEDYLRGLELEDEL